MLARRPRRQGAELGKVHDAIDQSLQDFIGKQHLFFVATAPLDANGLINVSPKGLDSLRILDDYTVVYADLVGSGIETVAHVKQNGRIVLMFCAFEGAPKIVRLHGRGEVIEPHHAEFAELSDQLPRFEGLRSFIRIRCQRISDSCGFGVPLFDFVSHRTQLVAAAQRKGRKGLQQYQLEKNQFSLDGLPGIVCSSGDDASS
ncbi:MAG: pyridoxamine 5'-phosphate oxidase family protein [Planctomycetales bacterium]|nr:pyridoxamine 5'-phosphate oxidase family protein [Planctomycetales bacterium]